MDMMKVADLLEQSLEERLERMERRQVRIETLLRAAIRTVDREFINGDFHFEPTDEHEAQEMTPLERFKP